VPIVSPPRLVGTVTVAHVFGVQPARVRRKLADGHPLVMHGYLGKVCNRHTWNLHELLARLFHDDTSLDLLADRATATGTTSGVCEAVDCVEVADMIGLCRVHLRKLLTSFRHAPDSTLVQIQLLAMCQWVVDRNAHLVLPAGFDPWSTECMNPGCQNPTNVHGENGWHGPLCPPCSEAFWNNPPDRPRPAWWKQTRSAA
jgi:hypothetical protein